MRLFQAKCLQFAELTKVLDANRALGQRHMNGDASSAARVAFTRYCAAGTSRRRILCSLHEAAHATAFERHGFRVLSVTIEAKQSRESRRETILLGGSVSAEYTPGRDRQWLVSIAAGPVVDEMIGTRPDDCFDGSDLRRLSIATRGDAAMMASILEEAKQEVLDNIVRIDRVSDALLESKTLTGNELRAIIGAQARFEANTMQAAAYGVWP